MLWFLYAVALLLVCYENRWIVCAWPLERPLWFSPSAQPRFFLVRSLLTYGTLVGLWVQYNVLTAGVAFLAYYALNKLTFKVYFDRKIRELAREFARHGEEEARKLKQPFDHIDQARTSRDALRLAKETVITNVKTGGRF